MVKETPNSLPPLQPPIRRGSTSTWRATTTLSASTPVRPSTPTLEFNLWASEPTLRFPLPQGSQDLADWLSSSDPNIMRRPELVDDGAMADSMAESSYEIISAANTDTEEQEDHYTGSMSESVASLDFHRPDDVHSLAGTEHTCDEEESVPDLDDDDSYRAETPYEDDENEGEHATRGRANGRDDHANDSIMIHSPTSDVAAVDSMSDSSDEEEDQEEEEEEEEEDNDNNDDQDESRSSLHYTQQSLGTPSLLTPMASRIVDEPPEEEMDLGALWSKRIDRLWELEGQVKDYLMDMTSGALPGMLFVLTFALVIQLVHTSKQASPWPTPAATPAVAAVTTMTTTETYTTTATATATATTTEAVTSTAAQPTTTFSGAFGLIPIGDVVSDDWLFGANKPAISFTAQSHHGVLIHIPAKIKKTWQARNCLTLTAKRGEALVDSIMSSVDEGIVVKFAKKEVHGIVTLFLEATCRPKVHKVVKVHFGKGLVEGALEMTRNIAQDLSKLVPATAQEAERRLGDARRSLGSVCQNVCLNVQTASETVAKTLEARLAETRQGLEGAAAEAMAQARAARRQVAEQLSRAGELQDAVQLYLLDAQISAKLWWLQTTGRREKRDDYQRKAESFVARKQAAARREHRGAEAETEAETAPTSPSWWMRRKPVGGA